MSTTSHFATSLLQLYMPVIARVSTVAAAGDFGDPAKLGDQLQRLLESARTTAMESGYNLDEISDAQYAVVAWIDETIRRSPWQRQAEWNRFPMTARLSLEPNAGVAFFDKLAAWMKRPSPPRSVIEVFYVCLGLGFQGRYFNEPRSLTELKQRLLQMIGHGPDIPSLLSPSASQQAEAVQVDRDSFPWNWLIAGLLALLLIEFLVLKLVSESEIKSLVNQL